MQAAWAWGLEIVPSLRPLCIMRLTLMQTMLHKYEEMQVRLKSQDEELENFHALEKERREHDLLPIRPRGVALPGGWHSQGVAGGETS